MFCPCPKMRHYLFFFGKIIGETVVGLAHIGKGKELKTITSQVIEPVLIIYGKTGVYGSGIIVYGNDLVRRNGGGFRLICCLRIPISVYIGISGTTNLGKGLYREVYQKKKKDNLLHTVGFLNKSMIKAENRIKKNL